MDFDDTNAFVCVFDLWRDPLWDVIFAHVPATQTTDFNLTELFMCWNGLVEYITLASWRQVTSSCVRFLNICKTALRSAQITALYISRCLSKLWVESDVSKGYIQIWFYQIRCRSKRAFLFKCYLNLIFYIAWFNSYFIFMKKKYLTCCRPQ